MVIALRPNTLYSHSHKFSHSGIIPVPTSEAQPYHFSTICSFSSYPPCSYRLMGIFQPRPFKVSFPQKFSIQNIHFRVIRSAISRYHVLTSLGVMSMQYVSFSALGKLQNFPFKFLPPAKRSSAIFAKNFSQSPLHFFCSGSYPLLTPFLFSFGFSPTACSGFLPSSSGYLP